MKYKKTKGWIAILIFLVGLWMNLYFSTTLHFLLLGEMRVLALIPMSSCIKGLQESGAHFGLFLVFQGFVALTSIYYYVANHRPYYSNLINVTPDISTPVPAGQKQFGSARWLTKEEQEKAFKHYELDKNGKSNPKEGGIILGCANQGKGNNKEKIYYVNEDTHVLCIGATRSGKTRSIVLQSLGTLALAGESLVVSDPKGELYGYTAPFLKEKGYDIICLDFKHPLKSDRYNFLQPIIDAIDQENLPKAIEATWDLTASLVPENSHNEKIWTNGEASIIASAIMAVVYDNRDGNEKRFQNLSNVYFFISEMCKVVDGSMPLTKYIKNIPICHPARSLLSISEVAPSKTRGIK